MTRLKLQLYLIVLISVFLSVKICHSQETSKIKGTWEGKFMGDFKARIEISNESAKILMYAGEQQIQDDPLSEMEVKEKDVTFLIPAKDTKFQGSLNEEKNELSGEFIFPDGSRHPITLSKQIINESKELSWLELKHKTYTTAQLQQDFQFLLDNLTENHPQLYTYISKEDFDQFYSRSLANLDHPMNMIEFYNTISPTVASIRCSHTGMRLPADFRAEMFENAGSFPLDLVFIDHQIFIKSIPDNSNATLQPGTEIKSINGVSAKDLIDGMQVFIPSEGFKQTTKFNELNRHYQQYLPLVIDSDQYEVEYPETGSIKKVSLDRTNTIIIENQDTPPALDFQIDKVNNIAKLKIHSFAFRDINRFIHLADSIFRAMQSGNTQHLVLDLRDNAGGHPIFAAQVLSYLTDHSFTYFKRNPDAPDFEPLYHPMAPNPIQHQGNLYVLINGGSLSTTGHFISLLKYYTKATFIGEQPGSTYTCNDGSIQISLPNTGIEANIPTTTFETVVEGFDQFKAFPLDYEVNPTIESLINGDDIYMAFIQNLISKNY